MMNRKAKSRGLYHRRHNGCTAGYKCENGYVPVDPRSYRFIEKFRYAGRDDRQNNNKSLDVDAEPNADT